MCFYMFECGEFVGIERARSGQHAIMSFGILHRYPAANCLSAYLWEHLDTEKIGKVFRLMHS